MRDKRKSPRVFGRCHVVVKVLSVDGIPWRDAQPHYCHAADLSTGGIRLVLGTDMAVGTTVELIAILVDPPATFRHVGLVRWGRASTDNRTKFVGIEFTASSPAVMEAWVRMLTERYPSAMSKTTPQFAKDCESFW